MSASNNLQKNKKSKEIWQSVRQNKMAMVGLVTLTVFVLIAIFGPILVPFSTQEFGGRGDVLRPPGGDHLLGTDDMGRDVLANLMAGARISLLIRGVATIISMAIGTLVGISAGYFGGAVDNVLMRLTDFFLVIPWLPLMMGLAAILGTTSWNIILVIGVTRWAGTA